MEQEIIYKDYRIKIQPDDNPESPNDWGNEEVFLVYKHRQFTVNREGFDVHSIYEDIVDDMYDEYYVFPVEAYIHSGVSLSLFNGTKQCTFDSSIGGYILVKSKIELLQGIECVTKEMAEERAKALLTDWNLYLSGEVYGYIVEKANVYYQISKQDLEEIINKPHGYINLTEFYNKAEEDHDWVEVDSCWGFYGDPEQSGCIDEAKGIIDYDRK
jgi:hypothetical protein